MRVITEEIIRNKMKKKELAKGATLYISNQEIVTPSAKGYLREQHIEIEKQSCSCEAVKSDETEMERELPLIIDCKIPIELRELSNAILKLKNLLFFPLIASAEFSSQNWLYFEQQQKWLTDFRELLINEKRLLNYPVYSNRIECGHLNGRIWGFCCNEIYLQIDYTLNLASKYPQIISEESIVQFNQWAYQLLANLKPEILS